MFIRRTQIKSRQQGEAYYTYRLVETERVNGKVKQHTLLNLGRNFAIHKEHWADLALRIEQLLSGQASLLSIELPEELEERAQHIKSLLLARQTITESRAPAAIESIDIDSLELIRPRRVGIEQLALYAMEQVGLQDKLVELGFNRHQLSAAVGNIVARMALPASELATHRWLQYDSGLGELLGYDFESMKRDRLYQASDLLWKHKEALEAHLYERERSLFSLDETITLFDLTNTFFEGEAQGVDKAKRGRSKEKRFDCPLITLGLVLDGSGFPRRSQLFPGNVSEPQTLEDMLGRLQCGKSSTVVMDAGIATEANIAWLKDQGYQYLVVSRKRRRDFDESQAVTVKETAEQKVRIERVVTDSGEVELYCHSQAREQKEQAMQDRFTERFEHALQSLHDGLAKKGATKRYDKVLERIGRLKEKYARAAQHYDIQVEQAENSPHATAIQWQRNEKAGSQATHPGVYCLRTNISDWDEETLWHTYTMLTDLESVFRSLKSELGLRPNYHHKADRIDGHLFITLLAYHLVHVIRCGLKVQGIHDSWQTIRRKMENQQRITASLQREDGRAVHIRKATRAEPHQKVLYDALGISPQPGSTQKTLA